MPISPPPDGRLGGGDPLRLPFFPSSEAFFFLSFYFLFGLSRFYFSVSLFLFVNRSRCSLVYHERKKGSKDRGWGSPHLTRSSRGEAGTVIL